MTLGVAVVTGGAGGIGAATVARLAQSGWTPAVLDIDIARAQEIAQAYGGRAYAIDLAKPETLQACAAQIEAEMGPITALAAVAAHLENPTLPESKDAQEFQRILDVNVTGTFETLRAFGSPMLARGKGAIVTIASITALNSSPLQGYGPSKAAIINMSRNFAVSWGKSGVRVNCLCPGPTVTPAVQASYARGERSPERMLKATALAKLVDPEDIANGIEFLLSDRAKSITGTELIVDSGVSATGLWQLYGAVD